LIIDIGCGRGELVYQLTQSGHRVVGLDYAPWGVKIARDALIDKFVGQPVAAQNPKVSLANAKCLPFPANNVDHVFMLDVIEHLFPAELDQVLAEIFRILKPGGSLIVHTMPNMWYYRFGYPLYRLVQGVRGVKLPPNPRDRWDYSDVHVNEQDPRRMQQTLRQANFAVQVWLKTTQSYDYEGNKFVRFGMRFLTAVFPFKLIFCNDIFAVASKPR
jgi:ubiquinone/menaquinone biosynthesis C-methylase UbiE